MQESREGGVVRGSWEGAAGLYSAPSDSSDSSDRIAHLSDRVHIVQGGDPERPKETMTPAVGVSLQQLLGTPYT